MAQASTLGWKSGKKVRREEGMTVMSRRGRGHGTEFNGFKDEGIDLAWVVAAAVAGQ